MNPEPPMIASPYQGPSSNHMDIINIKNSNNSFNGIAAISSTGVSEAGEGDLTAAGSQRDNLCVDEDHGIKFEEWGFKVDRLFEVAYRFYKRNESKAFHPSFDIRNQMNALILQARYGNYDGGRSPDIGFLDLVGKNRRHQWSLLKGMSKIEAMSKFICTLDEICPFFKAYAEAVKISFEAANQGHKSKDNWLGGGGGETSSNISDGKSDQLSLSESEEQLKSIHTSLNRQTYNQFKNYAERQYPNDLAQQKCLISTLQEQYYQQYISQMRPELRKQQSNTTDNITNVAITSISSNNLGSNGNSIMISPTTSESSSTLGDRQLPSTAAPHAGHPVVSGGQPANFATSSSNEVTLPSQQQQLPSIHNHQPQFEAFPPPSQTIEIPLSLSPTPFQVDPAQQKDAHIDQYNYQDNLFTNNQQPVQPAKPNDKPPVDTWSCSSSSNGDDRGSPLQQTILYEPLEPAIISTKKGVNEFKESLVDDKQAGSYIVKQGTMLKFKVPTYPNGRWFGWEFATDEYDIAFGLDFVYETNTPLAMRIYEEQDEDDFDDIDDDESSLFLENYDPESAKLNATSQREERERRRADKFAQLANSVRIVPLYRRDSHEEVFVGRHKYPGQGYYLLKFDNSYSVWRPKSLYVRIYYFI